MWAAEETTETSLPPFAILTSGLPLRIDVLANRNFGETGKKKGSVVKNVLLRPRSSPGKGKLNLPENTTTAFLPC